MDIELRDKIASDLIEQADFFNLDELQDIITAALDEYAKGLREQNEYTSTYVRSVKMLAENYRIQNEEFRDKLSKARDALEFYGDINNYDGAGRLIVSRPEGKLIITDQYGDTARKALKEIATIQAEDGDPITDKERSMAGIENSIRDMQKRHKEIYDLADKDSDGENNG